MTVVVVGVGAGKIQVSMDQQVPFTAKRKVIMALFTLTFLIMVYAVVPFDEMGLPLPTLGWWFPELSALFLVAGVVIGLIDRMSEEELVETYVAGCADLLGVAFIIGISRGITVLMNDGAITDTVLHWGEQALSGAGAGPQPPGQGVIGVVMQIYKAGHYEPPASVHKMRARILAAQLMRRAERGDEPVVADGHRAAVYERALRIPRHDDAVAEHYHNLRFLLLGRARLPHATQKLKNIFGNLFICNIALVYRAIL